MRRILAAIALCISCVSAQPSLAFVARGFVGDPGAPILLSAPVISPTPPGPEVTQQTSTGGAFISNTLTVSNGTWANCSTCTFQYQWYYYTKGTTTQGPTTATYTPPGQDTTFWPMFSSLDNTTVFAFVTAINSFGTATSVTLVTEVTRNPVNTVGGGNLVICSDSTCVSTRPVDNTLAVGDWVTTTGITATGPGYLPPPINYTWETDGTGSPLQAFAPVQTATTEPYQIQSADGSKNIKMTVRYNFNSPAPGGNTSGYNSFPAGPIVPASNPGGTIQLPVNTAVPTLVEQPTVPVATPLQAYVGFILSQSSRFTPGSWNNVPWNYTYQWMYCSTAAGSGVPAACGANPTPGSGASLTGTAIPGATEYDYPISSADLGRQLFQRVTAWNTAGTTAQDSMPTAAVTNPTAPVATTNPSITGYATVGNVGGGATGAWLVGASGVWNGPPTNFTYTWYSCPPATPTCMNVATGKSTIWPLNVNPSILQPVYQTNSSDLGNQIRLSVTAFNATSPSGVSADSNLSNTTSTFSQTPLAAGALKVYPAGRDPLTSVVCAQPPTTYVNNWYVNNQTGSDSNPGTSSQPFLTTTKALATAQPGDRILLQGVAAWNSSPGQTGNYGSLIGSGNNVDGSGNTDWITITSDPGTAPPSAAMVTGINMTGRGWNFDGLWVKGTSEFVVGASNIRDWIFQNGRVGYYPDLATAESDYNTQCAGSCGYFSIGEFLSGFNGLPAHLVTTGFGPRLSAQCLAITNNKIWFNQVGVDILLEAQDVLLENNDIAYFSVDAVDLSTRNPMIAHLNNIHDPISPLTPGFAPHQDSFQELPFGQEFDQGIYGQEFDSNIMILNEDSGMRSFLDQPYCTANGISPCTPIAIVGDESCLQWSNNFNVGTRWVNNLCLDTAQMAFGYATLGTIANNNYLGWDQVLHQYPTFNEDTTFSQGNYWANNATDSMSCYRLNLPGFSAFTNNVIIPLGTGSVASPGATCPVGWGVVDNSGINPFTATVPNGPTGTPPDPSAFVTVASTINLIPSASGSLFKTGSAANLVPTVTINGTPSTNPPNVGAY